MIVPLALEATLATVWLGSYLFTNAVVSPSLAGAVPDDATRTAIRSTIGRRYGALAAPLLLVWLVVILLQPPGAWNAVRAGLLVALLVAVGLHGYLLGGRMQALATKKLRHTAGSLQDPHQVADLDERRAGLRRASRRLTVVSLLLSLVLAGAAVVHLARA